MMLIFELKKLIMHCIISDYRRHYGLKLCLGSKYAFQSSSPFIFLYSVLYIYFTFFKTVYSLQIKIPMFYTNMSVEVKSVTCECVMFFFSFITQGRYWV